MALTQSLSWNLRMLWLHMSLKKTNKKRGSSCCGSVVMNLTGNHEDTGLIPGLFQCVKEPRLPSAAAQASSYYSSDWTPSLGSSLRRGRDPKKTKKGKRAGEGRGGGGGEKEGREKGDMVKREPPTHCWWEYKLVQPLCKTIQRFLKILKVNLPFGPSVHS